MGLFLLKRRILFTLFASLLIINSLAIDPVNPNTSPEARELLKYFQSISGKYILSGQHNFPVSGERNTLFAADYIGKTPVIWSQDFGFSAEGDKDSYLSRPEIIREAIRQHKKGAIITLCWHAVPPTADEPVTFQTLPGSDPDAPLKSVQGRLTDKQFRDILTKGTDLYKKWAQQVDTIASYLKQLQEANVPVLWRPYHEMNGDWFWWGGRYEGKYTTAALYRQIFDRMVKFHKLNNLIWIWSVDRPSQQGREFINYYPGNKFLDILAIDIYGNDFNQSYYEELVKLSEGKPVTLGEVGNPPSNEIIQNQPNWVYWVVWAGMVRGTSVDDYGKLAANPGVLFMEDDFYINSINEYRKTIGLDPVRVDKTADFSGEWRLNECESKSSGAARQNDLPYKIMVSPSGNRLNIKLFTISEYSDDDVANRSLSLDGTDNKSTGFMNAQIIQNANLSPEEDTLRINSSTTFEYGGKMNELKSEEIWSLRRRGRQLVILLNADSFMGREKRTATLVYDKR